MNDAELKLFIIDNQAIVIDTLVSWFDEFEKEYPIKLELQLSKRADEALDVIREFGAPDAVITGLVMQGNMDGGDFAKHLSTEFPATNIYVSSIACQTELNERFSGTNAVYLSKPTNRTELIEMVFTELSKKYDLSNLVNFIKKKTRSLNNDLFFLAQLQSIQKHRRLF